MDGDVLAEGVAVADDHGGGLALVLEVLGLLADGGEGEELVVGTDRGVAVDRDVGVQRQRSPSVTWALTTQNGPISTSAPSWAWGETDGGGMDHGRRLAARPGEALEIT